MTRKAKKEKRNGKEKYDEEYSVWVGSEKAFESEKMENFIKKSEELIFPVFIWEIISDQEREIMQF